MKAYFDLNGHCLGITNSAEAPALLEIVNTADVGEGIRPNDIWFDGSEVQQKEDIDLAIPGVVTQNDSVVVDVPAGSVLYANNLRRDGSQITFDTTTEVELAIELRGKHSYTHTLVVVTPDRAAILSERTRLRAHQLIKATPAQIDNFIENNITDLDSAKTFLKLLTKIVLVSLSK